MPRHQGGKKTKWRPVFHRLRGLPAWCLFREIPEIPGEVGRKTDSRRSHGLEACVVSPRHFISIIPEFDPLSFRPARTADFPLHGFAGADEPFFQAS